MIWGENVSRPISKKQVPRMWLTYSIDTDPKYFYNNLKPTFSARIVLNMLPYLPTVKDILRSRVMAGNELIRQGTTGVSRSIRHE